MFRVSVGILLYTIFKSDVIFLKTLGKMGGANLQG